jgi:16S rRNA (adenine1518-N6/adenine1519-N6)-dimethyltransferase
MSERPARKQFGQHFLHDRNIIDKIIEAINPAAADHFVEIGPGQGAMTLPLLQRAAKVDAIEIDRDLAADLTAQNRDPRLTIHQADALKFDFGTLGQPNQPMRLAGNLPYNISSPLLFHLLSQGHLFSDIHVMLQKEVVSRMTAPPGNRTYGRLTVSLAARCRVELLFHIKPGSFRPPPRVDSSFVRLVPDATLRDRIDDERDFDRIVRAAFSVRRKRLSNALKGHLDAAQIESVDIDPGTRAEQLDVAAFIRLANLLSASNR